MTAAKDKDTEVTMNQVHTYPDGTQVVGMPPFPAKSPKEEATEAAAPIPRMHVPQGVKQTGEADAVDTSTTREQFEAKVAQQLKADVMSGKDPETPNPTTDSAKPALANVVTADQVENAYIEPTAEDLEKLAHSIKAEGVDATEEEKEAAVLQVARETKGPIPAKASKAKGKGSK